jgi:hypothetical protein
MKLSRRPATADDIELLFDINRAALKSHVLRNFGAWDETRHPWRRTSACLLSVPRLRVPLRCQPPVGKL